MAARMKDEKPGDDANRGTAGHNAGARKEIIADVCRQLADIDKKRASLNAERSQLLQKKIKGNLGMKIADFGAAYRLYNLEEEAQRHFIDTIRETFEALGKGEQLDWISAGAAARNSANNTAAAA